MRLEELFSQISLEPAYKAIEVKGLSRDTRDLKPGDLFFVIEGASFDVFSVLPGIEGEVCAFVSDLRHRRRMEETIRSKPVIYVEDTAGECRRCAAMFYHLPRNESRFIGITGTNGKTTTAYLIYQLLQAAGFKASLLGTIFYYINNERIPASHTTPDHLMLRKMLSRVEDSSSQFVVMEVSSHGMAQGRVGDIPFNQCVFTNLSRDHLDYHRTMEEYFEAKKKLFIENYSATAILNIDDPYGLRLLNELKQRKVTYGSTDSAQWKAEDLSFSGQGARFSLVSPSFSREVSTSLVGGYNVLNLLAAISCADSAGVPIEQIAESLPGLKPPSGRLEQVVPGVFVDYAHTPDALEKALAVLRGVGYEKIICVFGCGGDRDKGKRPMMGKIAGERADFSIITSDNPRSEDPALICAEISGSCAPGRFCEIIDRGEALARAMEMRGKDPGCAVLVAGKGHEDYQVLGGENIHFSDQEEILKILNKEDEHT